MTSPPESARTGQAVTMTEVPDPQVPERARRRTYTAKYKRDILAEYDSLDRQGRGALLRREALYTSLVSAWREQAATGALAAPQARRPRVRPRETPPGSASRTRDSNASWRPRGR